MIFSTCNNFPAKMFDGCIGNDLKIMGPKFFLQVLVWLRGVKNDGMVVGMGYPYITPPPFWLCFCFVLKSDRMVVGMGFGGWRVDIRQH